MSPAAAFASRATRERARHGTASLSGTVVQSQQAWPQGAAALADPQGLDYCGRISPEPA